MGTENMGTLWYVMNGAEIWDGARQTVEILDAVKRGMLDYSKNTKVLPKGGDNSWSSITEVKEFDQLIEYIRWNINVRGELHKLCKNEILSKIRQGEISFSDHIFHESYSPEWKPMKEIPLFSQLLQTTIKGLNFSVAVKGTVLDGQYTLPQLIEMTQHGQIQLDTKCSLYNSTFNRDWVNVSMDKNFSSLYKSILDQDRRRYRDEKVKKTTYPTKTKLTEHLTGFKFSMKALWATALSYCLWAFLVADLISQNPLSPIIISVGVEAIILTGVALSIINLYFQTQILFAAWKVADSKRFASEELIPPSVAIILLYVPVLNLFWYLVTYLGLPYYLGIYKETTEEKWLFLTLGYMASCMLGIYLFLLDNIENIFGFPVTENEIVIIVVIPLLLLSVLHYFWINQLGGYTLSILPERKESSLVSGFFGNIGKKGKLLWGAIGILVLFITVLTIMGSGNAIDNTFWHCRNVVLDYDNETNSLVVRKTLKQYDFICENDGHEKRRVDIYLTVSCSSNPGKFPNQHTARVATLPYSFNDGIVHLLFNTGRVASLRISNDRLVGDEGRFVLIKGRGRIPVCGSGLLSEFLRYPVSAELENLNYNVFQLGTTFSDMNDSFVDRFLPSYVDFINRRSKEGIVVAVGEKSKVNAICGESSAILIRLEQGGEVTWKYFEAYGGDSGIVGKPEIGDVVVPFKSHYTYGWVRWLVPANKELTIKKLSKDKPANLEEELAKIKKYPNAATVWD